MATSSEGERSQRENKSARLMCFSWMYWPPTNGLIDHRPTGLLLCGCMPKPIYINRTCIGYVLACHQPLTSHPIPKSGHSYADECNANAGGTVSQPLALGGAHAECTRIDTCRDSQTSAWADFNFLINLPCSAKHFVRSWIRCSNRAGMQTAQERYIHSSV